jgi:hypothetical protein
MTLMPVVHIGVFWCQQQDLISSRCQIFEPILRETKHILNYN